MRNRIFLMSALLMGAVASSAFADNEPQTHWELYCDGLTPEGVQTRFSLSERGDGNTPLFYDIYVLHAGKARYTERFVPGPLTRIVRDATNFDLEDASPSDPVQTSIHYRTQADGSSALGGYLIERGQRSWAADHLTCHVVSGS
jgi:hypothetical protein